MVALAGMVGCGPDLDEGSEPDEVAADPTLGTLRVNNRVNEPIMLHLDGDEIYVIQPGRSYVLRNLPVREVSIYGVGRLSQKHYGLADLTLMVQEGGVYEWTINP